jgi:hypothetical protein
MLYIFFPIENQIILPPQKMLTIFSCEYNTLIFQNFFDPDTTVGKSQHNLPPLRTQIGNRTKNFKLKTLSM